MAAEPEPTGRWFQLLVLSLAVLIG